MKKICATLLCLALLAGQAKAASVRITSINDINLGSWGMLGGSVTGYMDMCVYAGSNNPAGSYSVNVSSPGGYILTNQYNQTLAYTLAWEDSGNGNLGSNGGSALSNNVTLTGRLRANTSSNICLLSGSTARIYVNISQAALLAAGHGHYEGEITIVVGVN